MKKSKLLILILLVFLVLTTAITSIIIQNKEENKIFKLEREHPAFRLEGCTVQQQNSIQAAYLGLTDEAGRMVAESFSTWDKNFRFPAFWGPNYDWTPDQDHGNVAMIALQRMVIQYENDKVYVLPAWPEEWDVNFILHAPENTTVECEYRNGEILKLQVNPEYRKSDIVISNLN